MTPDDIRTLNALLARCVTPAQIAELAGVTQPTVNNWCNRHRTFPKPVAVITGSGTRLFDLDAVAVWIDAHDYALTNGRQGVVRPTLWVA